MSIKDLIMAGSQRDIGGANGISRENIKLFKSVLYVQDLSILEKAESILLNILTACGEPWIAF